MSFNDYDTWTMTLKEDPERIRDVGPFTFDGELLTFFTDQATGAPWCRIHLNRARLFTTVASLSLTQSHW